MNAVFDSLFWYEGNDIMCLYFLNYSYKSVYYWSCIHGFCQSFFQEHENVALLLLDKIHDSNICNIANSELKTWVVVHNWFLFLTSYKIWLKLILDLYTVHMICMKFTVLNNFCLNFVHIVQKFFFKLSSDFFQALAYSS